MKKNLTIILTLLMTLTSLPVTPVYGSESASGNQIEDSISADAVSGNRVSGDSVSEDAMSDATVSGDTVSSDSISENTISENIIPENPVYKDTVSDDSVSENSVSNNSVSEDSVSQNEPAPAESPAIKEDSEENVVSYSIQYNGNKATSGSMRTQTGLRYDTSYQLLRNTFKKKGYIFTGWNTKKNGKGKSYADKATVKGLSDKADDTVTLYAQWKKATYKITYKLNGGKNNKKNPSKYTVSTKTITLKAPTKKGYTFLGWFTDSKFKKKITRIKNGSTGNKKLYAKWRVNRYTIHYSGNNSSSGDMDDQTGLKYGTVYKLHQNEFKRTGYKFTGWNTDKDGSGKSYADRASVKSLSEKDGDTIRLYAQWERIDDDETLIWDYLSEKINNDYGTAGLIGNLYAESGLKSNNLENTYNARFGVTDEEYTKAVDNGSYSNFANDSAGYGLAQWTYPTRKQGLLDHARSKGKSIGDLVTQLEYLWEEITESYKSVLDALKSATSVKEASDKVLTEYERPADQSDAVKYRRAGYGESFLKRFRKK